EGAAETTTLLRTFAVSAGPPRENHAGAAPSAATMIWSVPEPGPGTVTPFHAVTSFVPGELKPPPGNVYVAEVYVGPVVLELALVPKSAGKSTEEMPDCGSSAVADREKVPV